MLKKISFVGFFCVLMLGLKAQMNTEEALEIIKEDGIVIRLNTYKVVLDSISQLIERGDLSLGAKTRLQEKYKATEIKAEKERASCLQAFKKGYQFSKTHFVPDHMFRLFLEGKRDSISYDVSDKLIPESNVGDKFVFLFFKMEDDKVIHIRHSEYIREVSAYKSVKGKLSEPIGLDIIGAFLRIFQPNKRRRMQLVVEKLNTRLITLDKQ